MLFARGVDKNIWYNTAPARGFSSSTPSWPAGSQAWQNLEGGPFLSQPTAITWNDSTRLTVVAVGDPDHGARSQTYDVAAKSWNRTWVAMGGKLTSPVSLCTIEGKRVDLWAATEEKTLVAHNFWSFGSEGWWAPDLGNVWQGSANYGTAPNLVGKPGVVCRWNEFGHDIVVYDDGGKEVRHSAYSDGTAWTPMFTIDDSEVVTTTVGGFQGFQGDPTLLATRNDRTDFFGIGVDKAMYHGAWTEREGHAPLVSLGGQFQSVPSAVVTSGGNRVDVLALGAGATLMHRTMLGGQWLSEWEDLGVFGNSAPLLFNMTTGATQETVVMFVLGENGELNQTAWSVSDELSWKGLRWGGMGGGAEGLTASFMKG